MDRSDDNVDRRDKLIADHLHFPKVIAYELAGQGDRGLVLDDLIASGNVGLVEAADRFDPDFGVKFSTFAWPRIRGAMVDGLRSTGPFKRSEVVRYRAAANDGSPPPPARVVLEVEHTAESPTADEAVDLGRHLPRLARALAELPDREREVAHLHYFEDLQLTDVAERLGLSRSYVTRLHQRGLNQLQTTLAAHGTTEARKVA